MYAVKTRYGWMCIYESMAELDGMSYEDCVNWLTFNDRNGCYSKEDQLAESNEVMPIEAMKELILSQSSDSDRSC